MKRKFDIEGYYDTDSGETWLSYDASVEELIFAISFITCNLFGYIPTSKREMLKGMLKKIVENPNKERDKWLDSLRLDKIIYEMENGLAENDEDDEYQFINDDEDEEEELAEEENKGE